MRPWSLRAIRRFTRVHLYAQTAVHTHLTNHGYFDRGKTRIPPIWAPCRNKDVASSGISGVYLWVIQNHFWLHNFFLWFCNFLEPFGRFKREVLRRTYAKGSRKHEEPRNALYWTEYGSIFRDFPGSWENLQRFSWEDNLRAIFSECIEFEIVSIQIQWK